LDQLLFKCISITKFKLLSKIIFEIFLSATLPKKGEIQNTKYFLVIN